MPADAARFLWKKYRHAGGCTARHFAVSYKKSLRLSYRKLPIFMQALRRKNSRSHLSLEPRSVQHKFRFGSKWLERLVPRSSLVLPAGTSCHCTCEDTPFPKDFTTPPPDGDIHRHCCSYVSSIALCFRKCKCLSFVFTFWIQFIQYAAL